MNLFSFLLLLLQMEHQDKPDKGSELSISYIKNLMEFCQEQIGSTLKMIQSQQSKEDVKVMKHHNMFTRARGGRTHNPRSLLFAVNLIQ